MKKKFLFQFFDEKCFVEKKGLDEYLVMKSLMKKVLMKKAFDEMGMHEKVFIKRGMKNVLMKKFSPKG
jgi:hypothetical protein